MSGEVTVSIAELLDDASLPSIKATGLTEDSRLVESGDAFVAVRGEVHDGHDFANAAETSGAVCVLAERALENLAIPVIPVTDLGARRGALAARFYGEPSRSMTCVGITGTNGKTSIAHYIADMASTIGVPCGYMGTVGWGRPGRLDASNLTTSDAITAQRRLDRLRRDGCEWVAMEVSSHALSQGRVDDVSFTVGVFSNLTRDHLDYHDDIDAYGAAKRRLFEFASIDRCILNVDDPFGRYLAETLSMPGGDKEIVTYGNTGDVSWRNVSFHDQGLGAELLTPWGDQAVALPVFGGFSLANVAAAIAALCSAGLPLADVVDAAGRVTPVPGRMEFFRQPGRPTVVVDYAHTPDAVSKVLTALRAHCRGRLVCLVGCGGDRDPGKRPMMAEAAAEGADVVWLTSDNPRSENPREIIDAMREGLPREQSGSRKGTAEVFDEVDRLEAIRQAISGAGTDDLVVVAGKGHEDYQEVHGKRVPFSDREIVNDLLGSPTRGMTQAQGSVQDKLGDTR